MDLATIERRTAETLTRLLDLVEAQEQRQNQSPSVGSARGKTRSLRGEVPSLHWKDLALCNGDPDFDPFEIPKASLKNQRAAKQYEIETCKHCQVKIPCLEDGAKDDLSIRGGLLPKERRPRKPKGTPRETQPHGTHAGYVRHKDAGEAACEPCRKAHAEYSIKRYREGK